MGGVAVRRDEDTAGARQLFPMSRIPPLLEPLLGRLPPKGALTLVTSVLGASANWLVLRWLHALLVGGRRRDGDDGPDKDAAATAVVLVSFMRDGAFWRDGAAKMGLDLDAHARAGRFVVVDGLSALFAPPPPPAAARAHAGDVLLRRGDGDDDDDNVLDGVRRGIEGALGGARASAGRTVLVVDQVDALLAAGGAGVTGLAVQDMLLSLRQGVHAAIVTLAADAPLLLLPHGAAATRLEREHAALVASQAHAARAVVALRMLDTGAARDVSGVVRVAVRAAFDAGDDDEDDDDGAADGEYLYHVAGDGGVVVFERGA